MYWYIRFNQWWQTAPFLIWLVVKLHLNHAGNGSERERLLCRSCVSLSSHPNRLDHRYITKKSLQFELFMRSFFMDLLVTDCSVNNEKCDINQGLTLDIFKWCESSQYAADGKGSRSRLPIIWIVLAVFMFAWVTQSEVMLRYVSVYLAYTIHSYL